jgi:hypothetical protein
MIVEALMMQARKPASSEGEAAAQIDRLLPGLGEPVALRLGESSPAVGKTRPRSAARRHGRLGALIARSDHGVMFRRQAGPARRGRARARWHHDAVAAAAR